MAAAAAKEVRAEVSVDDALGASGSAAAPVLLLGVTLVLLVLRLLLAATANPDRESVGARRACCVFPTSELEIEEEPLGFA